MDFNAMLQAACETNMPCQDEHTHNMGLGREWIIKSMIFVLVEFHAPASK